ncbi:23S rRNA (cytidine(2498)-2'-O)-methyltransferase RlmM [Halorhodospira halochloris]|uniref:23S rRNA (cytidine(2498)-2'-O)-methyltransferase RlmM n=1 Tax=Halorhodospira halochloris TaxID=1052 RepID=UPI001EE91949|nr:23S rRNA (cytidine(2498)-2'-O)-methyltransferase RlmM [Halorhodospira halochloris]MCG5530426.1 23S rRNA (cytidine(2498)-2'-O)-methyltransferase RlmM [Halorhodospira halochloris]
MQTKGWLFHCRSGYESTLASEVSAAADSLGVHGFCRARKGDGFVIFEVLSTDVPPPPQLIFARSGSTLITELDNLPEGKRAEHIAASLQQNLGSATPWVEYPDSPEGRPLARFCRRFRGAAKRTLEASKVIAGDPRQRLHLLFTDSSRVIVSVSNDSIWPMGIPRLRIPKTAPSRSALKLEEALLRLVPDDETPRPGEHAIDLGAAPGGWSWIMRQRGAKVTAVDNGPLARQLVDDPGVVHLEQDAFRYRPARPADWLLCDVVDRPHGVAKLIYRWFEKRLCKAAVFNLKLPMREPLNTVKSCLEVVAASEVRVHAAQLYHDREEITVYARLVE